MTEITRRKNEATVMAKIALQMRDRPTTVDLAQ
jgi:hypothetical protein